MIRPASVADAPALAAIYNDYVVETTISFEETPVSATGMGERIASTLAAGLPWLVVEQEGHVLGYAYASPWRSRSAYRFSVESSVYLAKEAAGQGLGTLLYQALLAALRELGMHVVIGGIALPNPASVALHEKMGFRQVACFEEVGFKHDSWRDVGYWQLRLS